MSSLEQIFAQVQKDIEEEKDLDKRLNALEDAAVSIEKDQAPELARITLLHCDIIRAELEKSRRFWVHLSAILATVLVICISVILLNFYC